MIDKNNYYETVKDIDFSTLPSSIRKTHKFVNDVSRNGTDWSNFDKSTTIQTVFKEYFKKLEELLPTASKKPPVIERKEESIKPVKAPKEIVRKEKPEKNHVNKPKATKEAKEPEDVEFIERIPDELRFIRRYINLNGKSKTDIELVRFINALQKAILEKRIRKTSPYAKEMEYIQKKLIEVYNGMKGDSLQVQVNDKTLKEFTKIVKHEKVFLSIQYIKRYVNLHGKTGIREKARKLFDLLNKAVKQKKITGSDKYTKKLNEIYASLKTFLDDENQTKLPIDKAQLNGLIGVLDGCNCNEVGELGELDDLGEASHEQSLMNSLDFVNMKFETIGLKGKWLKLMGDPAPGFTAMVYGKPKTGKSFLCVEFAGYLARNHGKVLYVAREEGLFATLQKKLLEKEVGHPNLFISDYLPEDLTKYDFIFLDSVTKLGLTPNDIEKLRKNNLGKSFIFVFQVTKDGHFRGRNDFQHDVDIVIEVLEHGRAVQFGRYNQGGEIQIFE